jgi:hypothetical protein
MSARSLNQKPRGDGLDRAQLCRSQAVKAGKRAAQASDSDIRSTFLSMKAMWLDLADEIDRRQTR